MIEDTQIKEGNYKLACFDSSLPQIVRKDWTLSQSDRITYKYGESKIKR
ncbi:hypothetical protein Gogos_021599 [Gossypium gossypioides]|uniref:Uncharacterized protein n=1 Tax=Gossypium gossypioides TaxID=34282 RepID=A0A7J9D7P4_GOSGO|nr:hypothetical protein [Gossypium gossypioides]